VGLTDVKRVTSKIDGPVVAVVVEHTLSRCPHTVPRGSRYTTPFDAASERADGRERERERVGERRREGGGKRQRDDEAREGGKGCVAEGMKNGGWIIQSGHDDGGGERRGGFATGGIARPL